MPARTNSDEISQVSSAKFEGIDVDAGRYRASVLKLTLRATPRESEDARKS